MCGICGYFDGDNYVSDEVIAALAATLAPRGPDDLGTWVTPRRELALGHTRLSILDLSPEGHQPMHSGCGRWHLVFNGEIYNHVALRQELLACGCAFRGQSDTEVLLAAIAEWGIRATLPKLVGMFALAAWNDTTETLTLAVDRLGEKPLYYGWFRGVFAFASELKALRAHPAWEGKINRAAVVDYLAHGYIGAPRSIYQGIAKLSPGCLLELPLARGATAEPRSEPYWRPMDSIRLGEWKNVPAEVALEELERRLSAAIDVQRVADVPLGAFLSGGVDSSLVVALMQARSGRPIRTFAIGFDEPGYDESPYARAVARHLGTEHAEAVMTRRDVQDVVSRLAGIYDEPFADPSAVPVCFLTAFARRHVTVSLSGDAGDELFLGYTTYRHVERAWRLLAPVPQFIRRGVAGALGVLTPGLHQTRLKQLQRLLPAVSPQHLHRLLTSGEAATYLAPGFAELAGDPGDAGVPEGDGHDWWCDLSLHDLATYLPGDILVKVDRAAMAVGLETRVPLLDHRVVELALALPTSLKMRDGRGKWILRKLLDRYVPRHLVDRPKMGFGAPVGIWLRGPLRDWAEGLLCQQSLADSGLLEPTQVGRLWRAHLAGKNEHYAELWRILMLQNWLQSYVKSG